jgi:hypothetical protein
VTLPFWLSIGVLSLLQGVVVAIGVELPAIDVLVRARSRSWALIPAGSVIVFVVVVGSIGESGAQALSYLALVGVPILAAVALVFVTPTPRRARALVALALFALAWADKSGLAGEAAAVALTALSCVTLGLLIAYVTPERALAAGIVTMAIVDSALVISDLLQHPNNVLNGAHPAAGLPRLQAATFGSAVMGYGDLFVAGAFGGLLALHATKTSRLWAAATVAVCAAGFDLLFFFVDELPATVPVALALLLTLAWRRLAPTRAGSPASARGHARLRVQ